MNHDKSYHVERQRQCREMAEKSSDPDVRRVHEELALLHAALIVPSKVTGQSAISPDA